MGADKSFNDARVLRSDETTLLKRQLRMLVANLEQGEHNLGDLRRLDAVSAKADAELDGYGTELDRLGDLMAEVAREAGVDSAEFRGANREAAALIAGAGATPCGDVILTTTEWDWLKGRWNANAKLIGTRSVRADILAIDDVVNNARGVRITRDKQVWVQGEGDPGSAPSRDEAAT